VLENPLIQETEKEIQCHPAWHGQITGMYVEAILRGHPPLTYLLRTGEAPYYYYLSFVQKDHSFCHRPFTIKSFGKPTPLDQLIEQLMDCDKQQAIPLLKQAPLTTLCLSD
jgi:hypothetical protein